MFTPGRNAGADIHSASWGGEYRPYGTLNKHIDTYIHNNEDFIMFAAAGNAGGNDLMNTVNNPAAAKNVIAGES